MRSEPVRCCQIAGAQSGWHIALATRVPWLEGAMRSSTIPRVSGQYFSAHRPIMPPWLCPTIEIFPSI